MQFVVSVGLSGAMSNVSVGRRATGTTSDDCHGFLLEQMQQHHSTGATPPRKRPHSASSPALAMASAPSTPTATTAGAMDTSSPSPPVHKRFRLDPIDSPTHDL